MFTDMLGYTTLGQRNESLSLALVEEQRKVIRPIIARHNGREVKTIGDAFLIEFPNVLDAVRCAYDIQRGIREFNLSLETDKRIHLRIGIHVGEVVESQGDISGDAVNVASRIEPLAEDGGVCVTSSVYDFAQGKVDLTLTSIGSKSLKNVTRPMEVFKIVMPWDKDREAAAAPLDSKRIAVLPFVSMSPDPNDEYFADGMTEELISAISKVRELEVISRTSVMQYKNKTNKAGEIGRDLNVGTLLEGSVRKAGNRVRIAVQLINATSDRHLWADNYDRTLEDVFSIQSEIAQSVASTLKVTLLESDRKRLEKAPTRDPEAHALYLKARVFQARGTREGLEEAARFFQKAIEKDPHYVIAYAQLSATTCDLGFGEMTPPMESFKKGEELARRALALDPSLPEPHLALAQALYCQWDFKGAEVEVDRAFELDPNSSMAMSYKSAMERTWGRFDEAADLARRALELDPLSPWTLNDSATSLLYSRQPDEAITLYKKVLEIDPEAAFALGNIGVAYVEKGMLDEGIAAIRESIRMEKGYRVGATCDLAHALGKAGRIDELRGLLVEAQDWHEKNHRGAIALSAIYANMGEKDKAFEWLEKAFDEHSSYVSTLFIDYAFESLFSDPRIDAMKRRLGLN